MALELDLSAFFIISRYFQSEKSLRRNRKFSKSNIPAHPIWNLSDSSTTFDNIFTETYELKTLWNIAMPFTERNFNSSYFLLF